MAWSEIAQRGGVRQGGGGDQARFLHGLVLCLPFYVLIDRQTCMHAKGEHMEINGVHLFCYFKFGRYYEIAKTEDLMHFHESRKIVVYKLDMALHLVSVISIFNRIKHLFPFLLY